MDENIDIGMKTQTEVVMQFLVQFRFLVVSDGQCTSFCFYQLVAYGKQALSKTLICS